MLSDKEILKKTNIHIEQSFYHAYPENLVKYLRAWADILEEKQYCLPENLETEAIRLMTKNENDENEKFEKSEIVGQTVFIGG